MQPFFVETNVCYYLGILCYFKRFAVGFIIKIHQSPGIFNLLRYEINPKGRRQNKWEEITISSSRGMIHGIDIAA